MHWRLMGMSIAALALLGGVPSADAQPTPAPEMPVHPAAPASVQEAASVPPIEPEPDPIDSQEIGVLLGASIGGGVSPGGVAMDGRYLYRLSELDWFEVGVNFAMGSGDAECFRDRESVLVCQHGIAGGFAAEASLALRRYFTGQQQFRPYGKVGLGVRLVSFSGDDLRGVAIPVTAGAGVRVDVADRVLVVAEASLRAGPAFFTRDLGLEENLGLAIGAGVEFTLE